LKKDFFLAGGLNKDNITQAIEEFEPYAVDLSSSLEVNGFKNEDKIKEIMEIINE
jgi:phosphoribosylanthranilate isomerase